MWLYLSCIDALHLSWNVDTLRAMCQASFASDAMVCLSQFCHAAVVSDEECAASFTVVLVLHFGDIALVDTFIIVGNMARMLIPKEQGIQYLQSLYGLAYVDIKLLHPHHIGRTADGRRYIRINRKMSIVDTFLC